MRRRPFFAARPALSLLLLAVPLVTLRAQDYERLAPKVPPIQQGQIEMPPLPPRAEGDDTKVLVKNLEGLIFVDSPEKVRKAGVSGVKGVQAEGLPLLQDPEFRRVTDSFIGKPVTLRSLNDMVREIVIYYRENDRPVVDVIVPEQEITSGVIQLVVIEARLGQVRVEGNDSSGVGACLLQQVECQRMIGIAERGNADRPSFQILDRSNLVGRLGSGDNGKQG